MPVRFQRSIADTVRQTIVRESHGRIHELKIDDDANTIVIRGKTDSYHSLQLAIETVRRLRTTLGSLTVRFAVTVDRSLTLACR